MKRLGVLAVMAFAFSCSDSGNGKTDAPKTADAPHDTRSIDAPHADAALDAPPGTQQLTVKNYLNWCKVAVGSGSASAAAEQQVFEQPGQVTLTATPVAGFELDTTMWHHTDGDASGSGEAGMQTGTPTTGTSTAMATVTATASKCVWVCCRSVAAEDCPTTDQCP